MLLAPGAFMTTMPRALAAATSTLSTPVPARAMTRSFGAAAISGAVTLVALRTTRASASWQVDGELVGCPAGAGVDVPAFGAQQVERGGGKVVSDNNFQWLYPDPAWSSDIGVTRLQSPSIISRLHVERVACFGGVTASHYDGANR